LAHTKQQKESISNNAIEPVINAYQNLSTTNVSVPTVLVVDDSAMMRKTLTLTLQKVGYRVLQARDGQEALELLLQNSTVDLIVSDLEMPRLNGFEFLNELRKNPLPSTIPVVMLTTRINDKHRQLALHLGASAYMSKPYIEQEFLDVLRNTVNRQANISALPYAA
ncbi:MAG: response regulator, partial [Waterburya sp.]